MLPKPIAISNLNFIQLRKLSYLIIKRNSINKAVITLSYEL